MCYVFILYVKLFIVYACVSDGEWVVVYNGINVRCAQRMGTDFSRRQSHDNNNDDDDVVHTRHTTRTTNKTTRRLTHKSQVTRLKVSRDVTLLVQETTPTWQTRDTRVGPTLNRLNSTFQFAARRASSHITATRRPERSATYVHI